MSNNASSNNARFTNIAHSDTILSLILDGVLKDYDATSMLQYLSVFTLINCGMFTTAIKYLNGLTINDTQLSKDRDAIVEILKNYDAFRTEEE